MMYKQRLANARIMRAAQDIIRAAKDIGTSITTRDLGITIDQDHCELGTVSAVKPPLPVERLPADFEIDMKWMEKEVHDDPEHFLEYLDMYQGTTLKVVPNTRHQNLPYESVDVIIYNDAAPLFTGKLYYTLRDDVFVGRLIDVNEIGRYREAERKAVIAHNEAFPLQFVAPTMWPSGR